MKDLQVQDRLAQRFLGCAPAWVAFDREEGVERLKPELGRELVQVVQVRKVVDLRQNDRLARPVEARIPQRLEVGEREEVRRREAPATHREAAPAPVVGQAADAADGGELRREA